MSQRCLGCMEQFEEMYDICPFCGYEVGTPAEDAIHLNPGTMLHDRYIMGRVLGYGGFGVTYIGWDGKLEQKVAIKEYLPSEFSTRMPGQTCVTIFNGDKPSFTAQMILRVLRFACRKKNVITIFQNHEDENLFLKYRITTKENIVFIKGSGVDLNEYQFSPEN